MKIGPGDQSSLLQNLASSSSQLVAQASLSKASSDIADLKGRALADIDPVESVKDAEKVFGKINDAKLDQLKETVKGFDFTAISQIDLGQVAFKLMNQGLISEDTAYAIMSTATEFDDSGQQINRDVPFNSLEISAQKTKVQQDYASGEGKNNWSSENGYDTANAMTRRRAQATHVLYALSYFASSDAKQVGVDVKA